MRFTPPRRAARSLASTLLATFAIGRSREGRGRPSAGSAGPDGSTGRRFRAATAAGLAGTCLLTVTGTQVFASGMAAATTLRASGTGFSIPFSGPSRYEYLAPTEATSPSQLNQPIGQQATDYIARNLGLRKEDVSGEGDRRLAAVTSGRVLGVPGRGRTGLAGHRASPRFPWCRPRSWRPAGHSGRRVIPAQRRMQAAGPILDGKLSGSHVLFLSAAHGELAVGGVADDLRGGPVRATRFHRDAGCAGHIPAGLTKGRPSMLGLRCFCDGR